jgi:uncharacterized SAM-binding protein YcdF (DUF218 family)
MLRRFIRAMLILLSLSVVAGAAQVLYIAWRINWTGAHDSARPADAIIVLGALVEPDGQPGPDLRARTLHAVELFKQGLAPAIICTGGYEGDRMSAAAVSRRLAISQGVPAGNVLVADGSMTTGEDAVSASKVMASFGWMNAILVSHPLHLERARILFEAQGISVYPSPTSSDLSAIPWRTRSWLTAREAIGIIWGGLEQLGVPYGWTRQLGRWIYRSATTPGTN